MENEDQFLHTYFTYVSQLSYEKAKDCLDKEKETLTSTSPSTWGILLNILSHLMMAEKSYIDLGFLQTKNKGFLRKDNSLRSVYEAIKNDIRKLEMNYRSVEKEQRMFKYIQNIFQFLSARLDMIDLYEKIYNMGTNRLVIYSEIHNSIENLTEKYALCFTDISMTPLKATFSLEIEILQQLFKALMQLQKLQFLPSLALIHGAHTRLTAWESKMSNRESWKLSFLKNNSLPPLFQWLQKLKGAVLSKFSLYFHDTLAQQTTPHDMRQLCSKLHHDYYHKMVSFQRKHEAACVILMSNNQISCDITDYDSFPIIVSYPPRSPPQLESILRMISDSSEELCKIEKIIYKFSSQGQITYILATVEPNVYLVIIFESKRSEKDTYIASFVTELCVNLRCTKVLTSLKSTNK